MGSRGAFVDVKAGDFSFNAGGQHYKTVGILTSNPKVRIIIQDSNRVKAPEYSHTPGVIYAVVKDGMLKHLAYYDEKRDQAVLIDLAHTHDHVQPHRHEYMRHNKKDPGVPPTAEEQKLIQQIKKEFQLK
ncbi:MAG: hypothetical protein Q4G03_11130 [Planctomycetia bacterium]|nr:hypothetical protein [Planctomycetia bacterium]